MPPASASCMPSSSRPAPARKPGAVTGVLSIWRGRDRGNGGSLQAQAMTPLRWPLSSPPGTEKRCALLLYGLPKYFSERSFPSLHKRILERIPYPVDIFIHTYDLRETSNSRNGEVACRLDPDEVRIANPLRVEMQSQDAVDNEHQSYFNEMKRHGDAWFNHFVSLRNVLRQYNSIKRAYALMEQEQREKGIQYTAVCCSRMDVLYLDDLPDECVSALRDGIQPGTVFVPRFHEWELRGDNLIYPTGGMNDRFAIGCRHAMGAYANRMPACVEYCRSQHRMFHTETFLKAHLKQTAVTVRKMRAPFRFQRIRGTGQVHDIDSELQEKNEQPLKK